MNRLPSPECNRLTTGKPGSVATLPFLALLARQLAGSRHLGAPARPHRSARAISCESSLGPQRSPVKVGSQAALHQGVPTCARSFWRFWIHAAVQKRSEQPVSTAIAHDRAPANGARCRTPCRLLRVGCASRLGDKFCNFRRMREHRHVAGRQGQRLGVHGLGELALELG